MSEEVVFKVGDVVVLKSGSPFMTIDYISEKHIFCKWFGSQAIQLVGGCDSFQYLPEMQEGLFVHAALNKV